MEIKPDDLSGPEIQVLLAEHLRSMHAISPPESCHALDLEGLRQPGVSFWSAWAGGELLGCGALKQIDARHGEIKSMRTGTRHHRQGVARALLLHIVAEAERRGLQRLSLETGAQAEFEPARRLYESFGFDRTGPFESYLEDPNSVFMTMALGAAATGARQTIAGNGGRQNLEDVLAGENPTDEFLREFIDLHNAPLAHPGGGGDVRTPE